MMRLTVYLIVPLCGVILAMCIWCGWRAANTFERANSFTGNIITRQERAHPFDSFKRMSRIRCGGSARSSSALHGGWACRESAERRGRGAGGPAREWPARRRVPASGTACCLPLVIKILSWRSRNSQKATLSRPSPAERGRGRITDDFQQIIWWIRMN
jgi:hypothetical protein